jgi:hypothetical protein
MRGIILNGLLFLCIGSEFSCTPSIEDKKTVQFTSQYIVSGEEILEDAIGILDVFCIDNYLIARMMNQDYFFNIYSLDSLKNLGKIVKRGNGPNEFPSNARFDHPIHENNKFYFWAHDLNYPLFSKINIEHSLVLGKTVIEDTVMLPFEDSFVTAFQVSTNKIIGRSGNTVPSMGRLKIYDPELKKVTKRVEFFPELETSRADMNFIINKLNFLYVSSLTMKPDGTRIASAMECFNQVDIFNNEAELIVSVKDDFSLGESKVHEYLNNEALNYTHLRNYYGDLCSNNDFIFALFRDQPYEKYGQEMIAISVRIFDWDGNPLAEVKIPEYLTSIALDEKNGHLIGFSHFEEKLLRYDIKDILNEIN